MTSLQVDKVPDGKIFIPTQQAADNIPRNYRFKV